MKKYTLLGHLFELEETAHHFLARYIERIESYATEHHISREVIDDIKYSIIEKLYRHETPITEKQVIEIANSLGEPEVMFDESDESTDQPSRFKRALRIDKQKPMIRGVCYWLAKTLNVHVRIIRIIFLVLILCQGAGLIVYALLALFAPYKDKRKTTGAIGNILFELVRVVFWLFILSAVLPATVAAIVVTGLMFFTPVIDNQSIAAWIPQYMYVVGVLMSIALLSLSIGAIGSLFKQRWLNKAIGLLAGVVILFGAVTTIGTVYKTVVLAVSHQTIVEENMTIPASTVSGDRVTIDLTKINSNGDFWDFGFGNADIVLIRTTGTDMEVKVETSMKGMSDAQLQYSASKLVPLLMTGDAHNIIVGRQPNAKLFSEEVPLGMTQRHIIISVPANKEVYINKNRRVNMSVQNDASQVRVSYCDAKVFVYDRNEEKYTCNDNVRDDRAYDHIDMEGIIEDRIEREGLDRVPPMYPQD